MIVGKAGPWLGALHSKKVEVANLMSEVFEQKEV